MASLNRVHLIGNLGQDPEVRYASSGDAVVNLNLATTSKWKDKATGGMKEETEWHRVSIFGKAAEVAGQYLKKGSAVYVEGKIKSKKYTDKQGIERTAFEITCENFQMLGGKTSGDKPAPKQEAKPADDSFTDDQIPF
jgi:single-strand DNA-binding protein